MGQEKERGFQCSVTCPLRLLLCAGAHGMGGWLAGALVESKRREGGGQREATRETQQPRKHQPFMSRQPSFSPVVFCLSFTFFLFL